MIGVRVQPGQVNHHLTRQMLCGNGVGLRDHHRAGELSNDGAQVIVAVVAHSRSFPSAGDFVTLTVTRAGLAIGG
jgi:hypothetical protein